MGKHREFKNFIAESRNQESMFRKSYCVTSGLFFMFKLSFYYGNTLGNLKLPWEISGITQGTLQGILLSEMNGNYARI